MFDKMRCIDVLAKSTHINEINLEENHWNGEKYGILWNFFINIYEWSVTVSYYTNDNDVIWITENYSVI